MGSQQILTAAGALEVANTTTETSIFSGTVPGGTLGTASMLIIRMIGDTLNNSGTSTHTFTLRFKYGGVTFITFTSVAQVTAANRRGDITMCILSAENSVSIQRGALEHKQGGTNSAAGGVGNGNDHNTVVNSNISVNSAVDQTLEITVQLSAVHAELRFRRNYVSVEHNSSPVPTSVGVGTRLLGIALPNQAAGEGLVRGTTTETSAGTFTIPGGSLGTDNLLIVQILGDIWNVSGSAQWWFVVTLGGTRVFDPVTGTANPVDVRRYAFPGEIWIAGYGTTGSQVIAVNGEAIATGSGSGEGDVGNTGWNAANSTNLVTLDSTADLVFDLRIDFNVNASQTLDYRLNAAMFGLVA